MDNYNSFYQQDDGRKNRSLAVLSYFGILVLIPLLMEEGKNSPFIRFHANQGLVLLIIEVVVSVLSGIFGALAALLPILSSIVTVLLSLVSVGTVVLQILGIISAAKREMKPLPVIGGLRLVK